MNWYKINTPAVKGYKVYYPNGASMAQKLQALHPMLDFWQEYCERNWLSENHENPWCPENKVKKLLDDAGSFLLRCNSGGFVLSDYKEKRIAEMECSLDELLEKQWQIDDGYDIY